MKITYTARKVNLRDNFKERVEKKLAKFNKLFSEDATANDDESTDYKEVTTKSLLGINAGMGSDMRIYFKKRKPVRFSTYVSPDMKMYPPDQLPAEERLLPGFRWLDDLRPKSPDDVFRVTK